MLTQLEPDEVDAVRTWPVDAREKSRQPNGKIHVKKPAILGIGWL